MVAPQDSWERGAEGASRKDRAVPPVSETTHPRGEQGGRRRGWQVPLRTYRVPDVHCPQLTHDRCS